MASNTITLTSNKSASNLQQLFAKMSHVFYGSGAVTKSSLGGTNGDVLSIELPVLSDGVTFNMGEPDKTEIKLTTGAIWTSRADKGDSDISFQVASLNGAINDLFMKNNAVSAMDSLTISGTEFGNAAKTFSVKGYSTDVNKVTGHLVMTDDTGDIVIILPNVEIYAGLVVSDGDNPAYYNCSVTPKQNTDGADILILTKTNANSQGS